MRRRVGISLAVIAGVWAIMGLATWALAAAVGVSPVAIAATGVMALLVASAVIVRARWPDQMAEWSVRASMGRNDELDRPFMAFGDLRPDDFPSKSEEGDEAES